MATRTEVRGHIGELILDHPAGCPQLTPTDAGYALAFQDDEASWLGVYDDSTSTLSINPFVAAVTFGGAALQPPLAGLAPAGSDFEVLFDRAHGGELWRLTPLANWLREHARSRFLLTAPPLRLPGAVGSPLTPIATV